MSSSATRPIKPTSRPPARRERAKHYQLDAIAYMSVSGTSPGEMAATTGFSETYIARLLSEKRNTTFNKLLDEYKRKNLKNAVGPV